MITTAVLPATDRKAQHEHMRRLRSGAAETVPAVPTAYWWSSSEARIYQAELRGSAPR
jgi:hypothetical protein